MHIKVFPLYWGFPLAPFVEQPFSLYINEFPNDAIVIFLLIDNLHATLGRSLMYIRKKNGFKTKNYRVRL